MLGWARDSKKETKRNECKELETAGLHQKGEYHTENNRCYKPLFINLMPVTLNTNIYVQS